MKIHQARISLYFIVIILPFLLLGCGRKGSKDGGSNLGHHPSIPIHPTLRGEEEILHNFVSCPSLNCPEGVGKIAFVNQDNDKIGVCTAFLVAPHILMTNAHCIEDDLKSGQYPCQKRITAAFPQVQRKEFERVSCKRVIYSEFDDINLDYAFIELETSLDRRPFSINPSHGFEDQQLNVIWSMNPGINDILRDGNIQKQECLSIQAPFFNPAYTHKNYPYVSLGHCNLIPGNSGSPILNGKGEAIGIANITYDKEYMNDLVGRHTLHFPQGLTQFAGGNNFSCVKFPLPLSSDQGRRNCHVQEILLGQVWERKIVEVMKDPSQLKIHLNSLKCLPFNYQSYLKEKEKETPFVYFQWKLEKIEAENSLFFSDEGYLLPYCMKNEKHLLASSLYSKEKTVSIPILRRTAKLNQFGQKINSIYDKQFKMTVSPIGPIWNEQFPTYFLELKEVIIPFFHSNSNSNSNYHGKIQVSTELPLCHL